MIQEILLETQEEREKQTLSEEDNSDNNGMVLVACKDERSCMQLEDCITNNPHKVYSLSQITRVCLILRHALTTEKNTCVGNARRVGNVPAEQN